MDLNPPNAPKRLFHRWGLLVLITMWGLLAAFAVYRYFGVGESQWTDVWVVAMINAMTLFKVADERRGLALFASTGCGFAAAFPGPFITVSRFSVTREELAEDLYSNCFTLRFVIGAGFGVGVVWILWLLVGRRQRSSGVDQPTEPLQ